MVRAAAAGAEEPGEATGAPEAAAITLPAELGYAAAATLHRELMAVRERPEVVLDAGGVEKVSTAAVLVLVSFLNSRGAFTPPAAVIDPPGVLVDAFSELGLFGSLMRMEFRS